MIAADLVPGQRVTVPATFVGLVDDAGTTWAVVEIESVHGPLWVRPGDLAAGGSPEATP